MRIRPSNQPEYFGHSVGLRLLSPKFASLFFSTLQVSNFMKFNRAQWLNPRRKRFWAVVAVLLYTLLGFFVVPLVVKNSIINLIQDDFARSAKIRKVEFNPYILSLRVQGFELDDSDGVSLAAFDEFYVNFQLSSLFRWAWTFREIRLVHPYFFFERFNPDDSRLSRLLADAAGNQPDQAVALLKDADGVISIDLPVEGDINDPEFRIGGVVW